MKDLSMVEICFSRSTPPVQVVTNRQLLVSRALWHKRQKPLIFPPKYGRIVQEQAYFVARHSHAPSLLEGEDYPSFRARYVAAPVTPQHRPESYMSATVPSARTKWSVWMFALGMPHREPSVRP